MLPIRLAALRDKIFQRLGIPIYGVIEDIKYSQYLLHALQGMGVSTPFFPFGAAANPSLLYLILRSVLELKPASVLECGSGQSTLLFDALRARHDFTLTSLEDDPEWHEKIGRQMKDPSALKLCGLTLKTVENIRTEFYETDLGTQKFEMVLIDGPRGTPSFSRGGSIELLRNHLAKDFIVIFDDAERRGELETIEATRKLFAHARDIREGHVIGAKHQHIFARGRFENAVYFGNQ